MRQGGVDIVNRYYYITKFAEINSDKALPGVQGKGGSLELIKIQGYSGRMPCLDYWSIMRACPKILMELRSDPGGP
jgi:hypothetical protein